MFLDVYNYSAIFTLHNQLQIPAVKHNKKKTINNAKHIDIRELIYCRAQYLINIFVPIGVVKIINY